MSWHCSRALVAAFSEGTCSDGAASALSNATPTPDQFYWPDKTTEHSRLSRFGMTCVPLTADRGAELLTWFQVGFRAKTFQPQEKVMDLTGSEVGFGRKWLGLLARFNRDSRSWRTPQCSLVEGLDEFSETWPRWGSMRNGECWERMTAVPHTSEKESGLWPTPTASQARSEGMILQMRALVDAGKLTVLEAESMIAGSLTPKRMKQWPTPTVCGNYNRPGVSATSGMGLASAVRLWPTVCARDFRYPGKSWMERTGSKAGEVLPQVVGGPLNPDWTEWLMGWPIGQTELRPLETDKFQEWQQQHGVF